MVPKVVLRYGIFFFGPEKRPPGRLEATLENLKWRNYIKQSKNTNGRASVRLKKKKKLALL